MMKKILLPAIAVMFIAFLGIQGMFGTILAGDIYDVGEPVQETLMTEVSDIEDYSNEFYTKQQIVQGEEVTYDSGWDRYEETGNSVSNPYKSAGIKLEPAYAGTIGSKSTWFTFGFETLGNREDLNEDYHKYFYEDDLKEASNDEDFWKTPSGNVRFATYSHPDESTSTHFTRYEIDSNYDTEIMMGETLDRVEVGVSNNKYYDHSLDPSKITVGLNTDSDIDIDQELDISDVHWKTSSQERIVIEINDSYTFQEGDEFAMNYEGVHNLPQRKDYDLSEPIAIYDGNGNSASYQHDRDFFSISEPTFFMIYDQPVENFEIKSIMRYERDGTVTNVTDHLTRCMDGSFDGTGGDCGYTASGVKGDEDRAVMFRLEDSSEASAWNMEHYKLNYEVQLPMDKEADGIQVVSGSQGGWDSGADFSNKYYEQRIQYPLIGDGVEVTEKFINHFDEKGEKQYRLLIGNEDKEVIANSTYDFKVVGADARPDALSELRSVFSTFMSVFSIFG